MKIMIVIAMLNGNEHFTYASNNLPPSGARIK